ncbi:MAG: lysine transporter LysE [Comamonadaceae bacterium]|nr:MAG: lysine transporter LysE [Comamonadaceae bacterium]
MNFLTAPAFLSGMVLSLSLIMAIGPQNAHVMRMGLLRQHLWLTVTVCVLTDIVLIALGVAGLAQLGGLSDKLLGAMTGAGALVLAVYGWQAFRRFMKPAVSAAQAAGNVMESTGGEVSRKQAIGTALAFSWLNPHAWLDTAVVMGTASLAYAQPDNLVFGAGAATGSLVWFSALGLAMALLGRRLNSPAVWRALDLLVAVMMWGTAFWLVQGLV